MHRKGSCVVVILHIYQKYAFIFIIMELLLFEEIKDQSFNTKNTRSGEMDKYIFETYKNSVIPNGRNNYQTASGMDLGKCVCIHHPYVHYRI